MANRAWARIGDSNSQLEGLQPPWLQGLPCTVPDSLVTKAPMKTPSLYRSEKRLAAQDTRYAIPNGNNIIAFDVPNVKPIDFRDGYLMFDLIVKATGGTYRRLAQGAWSFINKVRITFGGMEDEIQYYNRLYSNLWNSQVPLDVQATIGTDLLGIGTKTTRNGWGASTTGTTYVVPFFHGLFRQGILPMHALSTSTNGQLMRVEFTMENPLLCVETDGTNPSIELINLRWHYTEISSADGSFENSLTNMVRNGTYKIGYETWSCYQNPILTSSPDVSIQWKGSALNRIVSVFADGNTLTQTTVDDKFTTWVKNLSPTCQLISYQLCLNEIWMPVEAVDCTGNAYRAYLQYLAANGYWHLDGRVDYPSPIENDSFNIDQFMITNNVSTVPKFKPTDDSEYFNPVTTSTTTSNTILRLQFTGPPPGQAIIYHFVSNNVLLCATSSGAITKKY